LLPEKFLHFSTMSLNPEQSVREVISVNYANKIIDESDSGSASRFNNSTLFITEQGDYDGTTYYTPIMLWVLLTFFTTHSKSLSLHLTRNFFSFLFSHLK